MFKRVLIVLSGIFIFFSCANQQVSFKRDVTPVLKNRCNECHTAPAGYGYQKSGLEMTSYDTLMMGTFYGSVIVAGDSRRSILNKMVEGRAGKMQAILHAQGKDIPEDEIELLRNWVDQGAQDN
jgi:uncharacterized membrane protein